MAKAWAPTDDGARRLAAWARVGLRERGPTAGRAPDGSRRGSPGAAPELVRRPPDHPARVSPRRHATVLEAERAIQARGIPLLWRLRAILIAETLLVVLGVAGARRVAHRDRGSRGPRRHGAHPAALERRRWARAVRPRRGGPRRRGGGVAVACRTARGPRWSCSILQTLPLGGYLLWYCRGSWTSLADTFGLPRPAGGVAHAGAGHPGVVGVSTLADVLVELRRGAPRRGDALDRRLPGAARVGHAGRGAGGRDRTAAPSRRSSRSRSSAASSTGRSGSVSAPRRRRSSAPRSLRWPTATGWWASPRSS